MKLIIAGSRDMSPSWRTIQGAIDDFHLYPEEVVSGCARGVDSEGEHWASHAALEIRRFPANWDSHGKAAGPIRNKQMAEYADALLLIWDGKSRGSANMKSEMMKLGKPVYEVILRKIND